MADRRITRRSLLRTVAYGLAGLLGTAVVAVGLLQVAVPVQRLVYDLLYLSVGPWTAEETATVLTFTEASLIGIGVPTLLAIWQRDGSTSTRRFVGILVVAVLTIGLGVIASGFLNATGFLVAIIAVGIFILGMLLELRYFEIWPAGVASFLGGVPVLVVLVLLLGFGLGWGGGYDVVATEVPEGQVTHPVEADFSGVPQVREDLFTPGDSETYAYCETMDGRRTCHLPLRGYEHEGTAARYLADHGVRCPFRQGPVTGDSTNSFLARHEGTIYRITCLSYGD